MKLILVTCPNCGGRLQIAEATVYATCDYCGVVSRLQARTRMLERVMPPPPRPQPEPPAPPPPPRVQPPPPGRVPLPPAAGAVPQSLLLWIAMGVPIAIGVAYGAVIGPKTRAGARAASGSASAQAATEPPSWASYHLTLVSDLDGDGVLDLIGRTRRYRGRDDATIMALDGKTGRVRWESESLGKVDETQRGILALAGDLVVFASPLGEVRAYGAKDGARRWSTTLPERVARFCERGAVIAAVGVDDVERPLRRDTGGAAAPAAAAPAAAAAAAAAAAPPASASSGKRRAQIPPPPPPCTTAPSDRDGGDFEHLDFGLSERLGLRGRAIAVGPAGRVAFGKRRKGSNVPVLVALDAQDRERWRVLLPEQPLAAAEDDPVGVAVGASAVCAAYELLGDGDHKRLACFAAADGRRRWDQPLGGRWVSGLAILGELIVFASAGELEARDLATGEVRWRFEH